MNTPADISVSGHQPDVSVSSPVAAAAVADITAIVTPKLRKWNAQRVKDALVTAYAYGMLAFGIFFPLALAAWSAVFWPDSR